MAATRHLIVFARRPQLGTGKRRLAAGAGALTALRFQRLQTARVLRRLAPDPRWVTWLAVTPDRAALTPAWLPPAARRPQPVRLMAQGRGDLGRRMGRALCSRPPGPAVLVGSDVPGVTAGHVAAAFAALGRHDAVLGPAADGGFWLVGLKRVPRCRPPFAGVRWSGPHALADTRANLSRLGLSWTELETLADVDAAGDLEPRHFR